MFCRSTLRRLTFYVARMVCAAIIFSVTANLSHANQSKTFSGLDGLLAFQTRAASDSALSAVLGKWNAAIQFYITSGINKIPPQLASDISAAGGEVDYARSQSELDQQLTTIVPEPSPSNTSSTGTQKALTTSINPEISSSSSSSISSSIPQTNITSNLGNDAVQGIDTSSTTTGAASQTSTGQSSDGSAGGSGSTTSSQNQNSNSTGANAANSGSSSTNFTGNSANGTTSYSVSTQFGRIIQALGGVSAGRLTVAAAGGFTNATGSRPPPLGTPITNPYDISDGNSSGSSEANGGGASGGSGSTGSNEENSNDSTGSSDGGDISGSTGGANGGASGGTSGSLFNPNFSCTPGVKGTPNGQCVTYVRSQFSNHPGVAGLKPLCTGQNGSTDCGARYAYLDDLWDLGYGKGLTPRNNSVIVWESNSGYGHMAAVFEVTENSNGTYTVMINDSNWNGDEKQMCAIPYEVDPSTKISYRNGNPNPKVLIGFIYGEPENVATDSQDSGSSIEGDGGTNIADGSTGGSGSGSNDSSGQTGSTGSGGSSNSGSGDSTSNSGSTGSSTGSDSNSGTSLGLNVSSVVFREYGASEDTLVNSQIIGTDISESDFLQANEQANPQLVSLYNAIKSNPDFQAIANTALLIGMSDTQPKIIFADDNQIGAGSGIHPNYNPNTNEVTLGNAALSGDSVDMMLSTAIHELAHSQQKLRILASTQLYGPDGSHYATEITNLQSAYIEGYAMFWSAYYDPDLFAMNQYGMSKCGFRREDSNSTPQNPLYNGQIAAGDITCESMLSWTDIDKDDFFKIEGVFASILLETALRLPDGFNKVINALMVDNGQDTDSRSVLETLGQILDGDDNGRFLLILDLMTNFQYSLEELMQISGTTSLTINGLSYNGVISFSGGKTGRELLMDEARKTVDHNGNEVRYNGFHALDKVQSSELTQEILPRIDTRALSMNAIQASKKDSNNGFFLAPAADPVLEGLSDPDSQFDGTKNVHNGY